MEIVQRLADVEGGVELALKDKFYFSAINIPWICLDSVCILLLIPFAPRIFSSCWTMYLQVLFGMFLPALVSLILIFLFLPFPNQVTKTQKQPLLLPKKHTQAPAPSMHLVNNMCLTHPPRTA